MESFFGSANLQKCVQCCWEFDASHVTSGCSAVFFNVFVRNHDFSLISKPPAHLPSSPEIPKISGQKNTRKTLFFRGASSSHAHSVRIVDITAPDFVFIDVLFPTIACRRPSRAPDVCTLANILDGTIRTWLHPDQWLFLEGLPSLGGERFLFEYRGRDFS